MDGFWYRRRVCQTLENLMCLSSLIGGLLLRRVAPVDGLSRSGEVVNISARGDSCNVVRQISWVSYYSSSCDFLAQLRRPMSLSWLKLIVTSQEKGRQGCGWRWCGATSAQRHPYSASEKQSQLNFSTRCNSLPLSRRHEDIT
jgi:hypothetical protein